jgi:O-antigen ligase
VIVLTFAVGRRSRGERLLALATAAPLVAALALTRSRGSFVAATAGLVVAFALLAGGRRWAMFAATLVAVGLAGLGVVAAFTTPDSLQARGDYWHVAWHVVRAHPLLGTGAGTYDLAWAAYGDIGRWGGALDAHSLYLESLAELGPVGLVLLGALLVPLVSVLRADRPSTASAAALGGAVTFLVHAGLDWDWEMPAVTLAGLVCLAAAIASRRERGASFRSATASTKAKGLSSDLRPGEAR